MRTILSAGCVLEPLVEDHAAEMFEVLSDPAIYEFENGPPPSAEWLTTRYRALEKRGPQEGSELWLNWVIRLPEGSLAGYVQATVMPAGVACLACELNSRHWQQGIGRRAVLAMLEELNSFYGVTTYIAVLKAMNFRSKALLNSLGFVTGDLFTQEQYRDEADEQAMIFEAQWLKERPGPS